MDTLNEDPNRKMTITKSCDRNSLHNTIERGRQWLFSGLQDSCDAPVGLNASSSNFALGSLRRLPCGHSAIRIFLSLLMLICLWAPVELRAAEVSLAWDPVSDDNLTAYRVYTRQAGGNYGNRPAWTGNTPTCTINDLNDNISYCFIVRALNINGIESENSNEVCFYPNSNKSADDQTQGNNNAEIDSDNDGMPDDWESEMGLDPSVDDSQLDSDGDAICNYDEYQYGSDPGVPAENIPPVTPNGKAPLDGAVVDSLTPQLTTESFADLDSYSSHSKTQWKIVRVFDELCVFDSKSTKHLTKFIVPSWVLEAETEYYWQVRFFDKHGAASPWSAKNRFETSIDLEDRDGNGVLDAQEVDNEQDLNGDGIPDINQPDTIKCVNGGHGGVLAIGINAQQNNTLISAASNGYPEELVRSLRDPVSLPYGIFEYKVEVEQPGEAVQITIFFPTPIENDTGWYQLGIEKNWIDYSAHAEFSSDRKSVTLELKDGGYGDIDGTENSVIVDRSGLMSTPQSTDGGISGSSSLDWDGSDSCFINGTQHSNEVKRFYLWLAVAGFAMMVLSKLAAIWHEKFPKTKKAQ